jgi:hypothetical protein
MQPQLSNNEKKGAITIVTVLLLAGILSIVSIQVLLLGNDVLFADKTLQDSIRAKSASIACAEIALNNLKIDNSYTGNETIVLTDSECTIGSISGTGNTDRILRTSGTSNNVSRKIEIDIAVLNPTTDLNYWNETDY